MSYLIVNNESVGSTCNQCSQSKNIAICGNCGQSGISHYKGNVHQHLAPCRTAYCSMDNPHNSHIKCFYCTENIMKLIRRMFCHNIIDINNLIKNNEAFQSEIITLKQDIKEYKVLADEYEREYQIMQKQLSEYKAADGPLQIKKYSLLEID